MNRCEAAIRTNADRCTNVGRSKWVIFGFWNGLDHDKTERYVDLCGTHLRAMHDGFYLWDDSKHIVHVRRWNSRRVVAA